MTGGINIKWIYAIVISFIILNTFLVANEFYYFMFFPVLLLLALLYIKSLDTVLFIITFFTPLSINYQFKGAGLSLNFPTEPLMIGVLLLFGLKVLVEGGISKQVLRHPLSVVITLNIIWLTLSSITSTMPLVSFKFLLSRLWFVVPFYFLGTVLFKKEENITKFLWLYIIPMAIVIIYTVSIHSQYGFDEQTAHWVMDPFFNDHTSYGAMLAFFFPTLIAFSFNKVFNVTSRTAALFFLFIFSIAIVLSYTRAAWVSLVVSATMFLLMKLRVSFRTLVLAGCVVIIGLVMNINYLLMKLEKNRQDSSTSLTEHVQSISNISSDASNLERLNRWHSAIRMFNEKPFLGFGPGTYMFQYAPYQKTDEKTIISTNAGTAGNAHSEYIGPLAEQGILGFLSFFSILIACVYTSLKLYYTLPNGKTKTTVAILFLGILTYFVHGALNNFLDTDKASVPFWAFLAALTAIDIYHVPNKRATGQLN
ncbi:MAG: O-antigen ligase family protein [Bacteroidia bacterium]|nr:O-antigen ligase family protein [Bacteroidia bacterium]